MQDNHAENGGKKLREDVLYGFMWYAAPGGGARRRVAIKARCYNDRVTIEIGRKEGDYFSADKRWEIQPDYGVRLTAEKGNSLVYEKPGFRVEETNYYHTPEFDVSEYTHTFETEQETAQYVIKQIAERVAHYRYLESLTARYAERNKTPNHELEEDAL